MPNTKYARELARYSRFDPSGSGNESRIERLWVNAKGTEEIRFSWWINGHFQPRPLDLPESELIDLILGGLQNGVLSEDFRVKTGARLAPNRAKRRSRIWKRAATIISALGLVMALATSILTYRQLAIQNQSLTLPYRAAIYSSKLESFRQVSEAYGELDENLRKLRGSLSLGLRLNNKVDPADVEKYFGVRQNFARTIRNNSFLWSFPTRAAMNASITNADTRDKCIDTIIENISYFGADLASQRSYDYCWQRDPSVFNKATVEKSAFAVLKIDHTRPRKVEHPILQMMRNELSYDKEEAEL